LNTENKTENICNILFDLDGTLADTAPDLAYSLNTLLSETGATPLEFEKIRPHVSHGASALIRLGFNIEPGQPGFPKLLERFLEIYRTNITRGTRLFPGMEAILDAIEMNGMTWGVVTNKPAWLTDPLLFNLGLKQRSACIVSGDSTDNRKPHPGPLFFACEQIGVTLQPSLYVGDAERDIEAGNNAGMKTLVALFGYISDTEQPDTWQADGMIEHPKEILEWVFNTNNKTNK